VSNAIHEVVHYKILPSLLLHWGPNVFLITLSRIPSASPIKETTDSSLLGGYPPSLLNFPTFRRTEVCSFWRSSSPTILTLASKCRQLFTKRHGVTTQNTWKFGNTAWGKKNSDLTNKSHITRHEGTQEEWQYGSTQSEQRSWMETNTNEQKNQQTY